MLPLLFAAPAHGGETEVAHEALQPDVLELVRQGEDGALELVDVAYAPNDDGLIVIEIGEDDQVTETVIPSDDLAAIQEVTATAGQYFFRVDRAGIYHVALVAEFPWGGTWTTNFQYNDGAPRTTHCRVESDQAEALHVLPVPAMQKGFHSGIHQLDISIPGSGEIRAIVLQRSEELTAEAVDVAPEANSYRPERGTVRFAPVRPIGAETIRHVEAPESEGRIEWSRLAGEELDEVAPIDAEAQLADPGEVLVLRAELHRDDAGASAQLPGARVEYERNPTAIAQLVSDEVLVEVDRRSGRLGRLMHRPSGHVFRRQAELPFRLMRWSSEQKALVPLAPDRFVCEGVEQTEQSLEITYEDRGVSDGERTVTYRMELVGRELQQSMNVDNQTDERVRLVRFPYMTYVAASEGGADDHIAWAGRYLGPVREVPGHMKDYHTPMLMYMSLYNEDTSLGFYLGAHDATGEADRMRMLPLAGDPPYDYTVEVDRTIEPGDTWSSQTHVVALHEGGWHESADIYRAWYEQIPRQAEDPEWLRERYMGAQNVYLTPGDPFSTIVDWWKQARWRGTFFMKTNGIGGDGFGNNFHPYPSPRAGGPEHLRRAVAWVNERGGQVDAYLNVRYYTPSWGDGTMIGWTPRWLFPEDEDKTWFRGEEWTEANAVRQLDGSFMIGGGPHRPFQRVWNMSFRSEGWYDYWNHWLPYYAELGLNVYWDQAMVSTYRDDLPEEHRRWDDANYQQGLMRTTGDAVEKAREHKGDFVIRGEGLSDRMMRVLHQCYIFTRGTITPMYRYTHPDQVLTHTVFTGDYERQCEDGLLYHMRILGGRPWGKGWGTDMRRLTQMRAATRDVSFLGRYMDNRNLAGETDQQLARYVVLDEGERQAVCINTVNRAGAEDWELTLQWPLEAAPRWAFAYTLGNHVRAVPFTFEDGELRFTAPAERISSIVFIADDAADRQVRAQAFVPMNVPGQDLLRISVANASEHDLVGEVRVDPHDVLHPEQETHELELAAGQARVLEVPFTGTADLQDFAELSVRVVTDYSHDATATAWVAPTLPNGHIELDELGNSVADYWRPGVRIAHEDEPGYALVVAAPGDFSVRDYIQVPAHLRPNTRYRLTMRARTNNDRVLMTVFQRDQHNDNVATVHERLPESEQWQTFDVEFTSDPEADAGYSFLTFRCESENRRHGGWIDQVRLEVLGPAEP